MLLLGRLKGFLLSEIGRPGRLIRRAKGFGFIQFVDKEGADTAIAKANDADFRGKRLVVRSSFKSNKPNEGRGDLNNNGDRDFKRRDNRRDDRRPSESNDSKSSRDNRDRREPRRDFRSDRGYDNDRYHPRGDRDGGRPQFDREAVRPRDDREFARPQGDRPQYRGTRQFQEPRSDRERGRDHRDSRHGPRDNSYERKDDYRSRKYNDNSQARKYERRRSRDRSAESIGTVSMSSADARPVKRTHHERPAEYNRRNDGYTRPQDKKYGGYDSRPRRNDHQGGHFEQLAKKQLYSKRVSDSDDSKPLKRVKRRSDSYGSSQSK